MRRGILPALLSAMCLLMVSCANGRSGKGDNDREMPVTGIVHKSVKCLKDTSISYACYFPEKSLGNICREEDANGKTVYPVIIAFDPHGNGSLPLTLYKGIADRYGFLMIGSNDSRNGLPGEKLRVITETLIREVRSYYPVDTAMIYLLGFSGGARVATMAGLYLTSVAGVTSCGAGFAGGDQPGRYSFDYFGVAGTADFNMDEILSLESPLKNAGLRHFIATFPGKHAWPPAQVIEDAMAWHVMNAMRDGNITKDAMMIAHLDGKLKDRTDSLLSAGNLIAAEEYCREAVSMLGGLYGVDWFEEELGKIRANPVYISRMDYRKKVLQEESAEKQLLYRNIELKDSEWWKKKIGNLKASAHGQDASVPAPANPEDTLSCQRLLSFLSLACYMSATSAIGKNEPAAAGKILDIYEMADEANPEPNYLRAVLLCRQLSWPDALAQIRVAVRKGFNDKARLISQPEFRDLQGNAGWDEMLASIK